MMILKRIFILLLLVPLLGGCSKADLPSAPDQFVAPASAPVYVGSFRASKASSSMAVDMDHNLYVCEDTTVVKYDRYGSKLLQFGAAGVYYPFDGDGDGQPDVPNDGGFWGLNDVAVDGNGVIYTLEGYRVKWNGGVNGNGRIQMFDANGFHKMSLPFARDKDPNLLTDNPLSYNYWLPVSLWANSPHLEVTAQGVITTARMDKQSWNADSYNRVVDMSAGIKFETPLLNDGTGWCYDVYTDSIYCVDGATDMDKPKKIMQYAIVGDYCINVASGDVPLINNPFLNMTIWGVAPLIDVTDNDPPTGTVLGYFVSVLTPVVKIMYYDSSGVYQYSFGEYGAGTGQLQSVRAIRMDPPILDEGFPGYIYVMDPGRGFVHKFQIR